MPFVSVNLKKGKSPEYKKKIGEVIYRAMVEVINVPEGDKFQVFNEFEPHDLNMTEQYLGNHYSADMIVIQITLNLGRTTELKKEFFKRIATDLHKQLNMRLEDVVITLVEVAKENWSFGGGIAQYAP